jgi:hypothetical protein
MPARRSRNVTPKPAPVEEPAEVVEESVVSESTSTRRKVSRETILEDFDSLIEYLSEMEETIKVNGIGSFRTPADLRRPFTNSLKQVRKLRKSCESRLRKTVTRQPAANTGLNRKLNITEEFADWLGIDPDAEYSRMDINRLWKKKIAPRVSDSREYARFCRAVGFPEGGSPLTYRKFQHALRGAFVQDE